MTPQDMLRIPVEQRRGAVSNETGSYSYILIQQQPDAVLDALIADGVIGAARRNCLTDLTEKTVRRPVGPWGMLVRLKGQAYTYFVGDQKRFEWAGEWAARHGWRVGWFSLDGMINTKIARAYDGNRVLFDFACGLISEPEPGFLFREKVGDESAMIRGEANVASQAWLDQLQGGGQALDLLARAIDAYVPTWLHHYGNEGKASIYGWDGDAHPEGDDELYAELPDTAYERVDVFTFGGPETLEPSAAGIALTAAVRACNAAAAKAAIEQGADPNLMVDDDESPLWAALGFGSPYLKGGRFKKYTLDQQLELMKVLLEAGAKADPAGGEPAIHRALHWADKGDEQTTVRQLKLLLDHGADPNALGTEMRSAGNRPLHVVAQFNQWIAVAKLLVSKGADAKLLNERGETPLARAQWRLNYLNEQAAKAAADPNVKSAGKMSSVFAMLSKTLDTENKQETDRLNKMIAFLTAAEAGTADVSDVDQLASAAHEQHEQETKKEAAERPAKMLSMMQSFMKGIGVGKELAPAEAMVEQNKKIYIDRHTYRPATDADFTDRDRAWYDASTAALVALGFKQLGDVVNETVAAAGVLAIIRRFVSSDGTSMGSIYQFVKTNKAKKVTTDLKLCEFESELSNGSFITTGNSQTAVGVSMPSQVVTHRHPSDTTPAELVRMHEAAKAQALEKNPGTHFTVIRTIEEYSAAQDRQQAIKAAFRKGIGYVDPAEIRRIAEQKFPADSAEVAIATVTSDIARRVQMMKDAAQGK